MNNFYAFAVLFGNVTSANSQEQVCDEAAVNIVAKYLKLDNFFIHNPETDAGIVIAQACKTLPQDKNKLLATFAYSLFDKNNPKKYSKNRPNLEYEKDLIAGQTH